MSENSQAKVYEQIRKIVDWHDDGGCPGNAKATGVRTSHYDLERLGWEEGDIVYPSKGLRIWAGGQAGVLSVMCDKEHLHSKPGVSVSENVESGELIIVDADPTRNKERELVTV